jgi:hypothetical protein
MWPQPQQINCRTPTHLASAPRRPPKTTYPRRPDRPQGQINLNEPTPSDTDPQFTEAVENERGEQMPYCCPACARMDLMKLRA